MAATTFYGSSPGAWGEGVLRGLRRPGVRFIPRCLGRGVLTPRGIARRTVHPQVPGERESGSSVVCVAAGSSPGAWGEVLLLRRAIRVRRFIPRCLGRGLALPRLLIEISVHPQVPGERALAGEEGERPLGSSPGAWGEGEGPGMGPLPQRFIPRCLGRGEPGEKARRQSAGSSPGAWGEGPGRPVPAHARRFIPRCLGRGPAVAVGDRRDPVHPQVPGERKSVPAVPRAAIGSSPGAWGEGRPGRRSPAPARFIPRCLGRGRGRSGRRSARTVHPQVPGERTVYVPSLSAECGSSPGAWGEGGRERPSGRAARFIPRCLGRGTQRIQLSRLVAVHPQVPGERFVIDQPLYLNLGSSPGAWGEGLRRAGDRRAGRFIPRCLGRGLRAPAAR